MSRETNGKYVINHARYQIMERERVARRQRLRISSIVLKRKRVKQECVLEAYMRATSGTGSHCVKINIGCGSIVAPGWTNFDSSYSVFLSKHNWLKKLLFRLGVLSADAFSTDIPPNVIRRDMRKGIPFPDDTVDFIYCSHMLEHLTRDEALNLLIECHRVLKPKGLVRIVVPDLEVYCRAYLERDQEFWMRLYTGQGKKYQRSADWFSDYFLLSSSRGLVVRFYTWLTQTDQGHKWMYDSESLSDRLAKAGFQDIQRRKFHIGSVPDLELLDIRLHKDESLYIEGSKAFV